ncbi:hypothetical protein BWI96_00145 [Siphonobacter sp. SORGH_AS_0500]|nr:hypothetical protein BWI96_00145 [Siphonobacter sp. SORGH_AS_0500]
MATAPGSSVSGFLIFISMHTQPPITQELLFRYFAGTSTAFEKQWINQWIQQEEHLEFFFLCLDRYESAHPQFQTDASQAFIRHQKRCLEQDTTPPPAVESKSLSRIWMLVACVSFLLIGGYLFKDHLLYKSYRTGYGETAHLTLSDGSKVILNANSTLREPRFAWMDTLRQVYLTGEANFSVVHTPDHKKLVVQTSQGMQVVVLGTEFTVYDRHQAARVVLHKGKIELRYVQDKGVKKIMMSPGDLVTTTPNEKPQVKRDETPDKYTAWTRDRFVFEQTSLQEIAQLFADNYGLTVEIQDPQLAQETISGSFTAHNGKELLELLIEASSLQFTQINNHIFITTTNKPLRP